MGVSQQTGEVCSCISFRKREPGSWLGCPCLEAACGIIQGAEGQWLRASGAGRGRVLNQWQRRVHSQVPAQLRWVGWCRQVCMSLAVDGVLFAAQTCLVCQLRSMRVTEKVMLDGAPRDCCGFSGAGQLPGCLGVLSSGKVSRSPRGCSDSRPCAARALCVCRGSEGQRECARGPGALPLEGVL